jgi:hypothetical protein
MQRIVVLLTIVFLLVGCSGCGAAGGMEKEAENAAMQELNKYLIKCGDVYCSHPYAKGWDCYNQDTKASISIKDETSEADRLNGFAWRGRLGASLGGSYRYSENGGGWTQWVLRDQGRTVLYVLVEKKKDGQWKVEPLSSFMKPVTCSEFPQ